MNLEHALYFIGISSMLAIWSAVVIWRIERKFDIIFKRLRDVEAEWIEVQYEFSKLKDSIKERKDEEDRRNKIS